MKHKEKLLLTAFIITLIVVTIALSAGIYNAVIDSNLPDWAKYVLLH
jgi:hypothetical protein